MADAITQAMPWLSIASSRDTSVKVIFLTILVQMRGNALEYTAALSSLWPL